MSWNGRTGGLPGTERRPRNVFRLFVVLGACLAGGLVAWSRPRWWPEAVVIVSIASIFAVVPTRPRAPRFDWPPWRGPHPVRNTVALALNVLALVVLAVGLWRAPGSIGSRVSMPAAFTLMFASTVASTQHGRRGRWLFRAAWGSLAIASWVTFYRGPAPRFDRLPASQFLSITARVDRGPELPSMAAPELSIVAPGGRTSGFDRASGAIQRSLPHTSYVHHGSTHSEEDHLTVSTTEDGTYAVEVIGTATGSYDLGVSTSDVTKTELLATRSRSLRDVPIVEGTVHRYDVEYSHDHDGMVRLRLVPRDAPAPQPRSIVREVRIMPRQLSLNVGTGCGGDLPKAVRLSTPGGRSAGFAPRGGTYGEDLPGLRLVKRPEPSLRFVVQDAADGEYVLEVSSPESATSYSLYVELNGVDGSTTLQQASMNCARTTVAAGEVHRWIVRLEQGAEVPLRIAQRSAFRAAELPQ